MVDLVTRWEKWVRWLYPDAQLPCTKEPKVLWEKMAEHQAMKYFPESDTSGVKSLTRCVGLGVDGRYRG